MKFKCVVNLNSKMKELLGIISTLEKHNENLIMIARPDSVSFTIPRDSSKPFRWFDINARVFFNLYRFEGVNLADPDNNIIYFEVPASALAISLSTKKRAADHAEIKLGKHEFPFFTVSIKFHSNKDPDKMMSSTCEVPIVIIPREKWDEFELPYESIQFEVQSKLPRLEIFKRFIDTFKTSNAIKIVLRNDNTLSIESENHEIGHFTFFSDVEVVKYEEQQNVYIGPPVGAMVDQRRISEWLSSISFPTYHQMSLLIANERYIKLFFKIREDIICQFVLGTTYDEDVIADSDCEDA